MEELLHVLMDKYGKSKVKVGDNTLKVSGFSYNKDRAVIVNFGNGKYTELKEFMKMEKIDV